MATRKIKIQGLNHDASTTAIVTWDGVEVFNGALTTAVVANYDGTNDPDGGTNHYIVSFDYTNADDTVETDHACSIRITAGAATIGNFYVSCGNDNIAAYIDADSALPAIEIDSDWYYIPGDGGFYGDGTDSAQPERTNPLVNGSTVGLLTADPDLNIGEPKGGISAPVFVNYQFQCEANDIFACNARVPRLLPVYVA